MLRGFALFLPFLVVGAITGSFFDSNELRSKRCKACEGGLPPYSLVAARQQVAALNGWNILETDTDLTGKGLRIEKYFQMYNFSAAIEFINEIGAIAEADGHHPDLNLVNYRDLTITLSTHAIQGLSENDFILAAKIDRLHPKLKPVTSKTSPLPSPAPHPPSDFVQQTEHTTFEQTITLVKQTKQGESIESIESITVTKIINEVNKKTLARFDSRTCIPHRSPIEHGIHVEPGKPVTCGTLHPETKRRAPTVFMLSGFICSGKSTFASDLAQRENALVFSPDEWILSLFGIDFPVERFMEHGDRVKETMWGMATQALNRGVSVVLDFSFWSRADRQAWKNRIEGEGWPVELYFFDTPAAILRDRLSRRNVERKATTDFYINPETFEKWLPFLEAPHEDEFPVKVPHEDQCLVKDISDS